MTIHGDYSSAITSLGTLYTSIETALALLGTHPADAEPNVATPDSAQTGVKAQTLAQAAINVHAALAALRESDTDRTKTKLTTFSL